LKALPLPVAQSSASSFAAGSYNGRGEIATASSAQ
jgi:hypothetical protein